MGDLTCVRSFILRHEAELAKMNLEAAGIEVQISGEDAGGMAPHFAIHKGGIMVMVRTEDLERANEILKTGNDKREEVKEGKDAASKSEGFLAKFRKWLQGN